MSHLPQPLQCPSRIRSPTRRPAGSLFGSFPGYPAGSLAGSLPPSRGQLCRRGPPHQTAIAALGLAGPTPAPGPPAGGRAEQRPAAAAYECLTRALAAAFSMKAGDGQRGGLALPVAVAGPFRDTGMAVSVSCRMSHVACRMPHATLGRARPVPHGCEALDLPIARGISGRPIETPVFGVETSGDLLWEEV
jgi:hypothetical protein